MKLSKGITKTRIRTTLGDVFGFKFRKDTAKGYTEVYNYDNQKIMVLHNTKMEIFSDCGDIMMYYKVIETLDFRFSRPFLFCRAWMSDGQDIAFYLDVIGDYENEE